MVQGDPHKRVKDDDEGGFVRAHDKHRVLCKRVVTTITPKLSYNGSQLSRFTIQSTPVVNHDCGFSETTHLSIATNGPSSHHAGHDGLLE